MRRLLPLLCTLLVAFGLAASARAQPADRPVQVLDIRVGYSTGATDLYKVGKWVPVLITVGPPKNIGVLPSEFKGQLEIETRDGDGWVTHIVKDNVVLTKDSPRGDFMGYTKLSEPGYQSVTVRLRGKLGPTDINQAYTYPSPERQRGSLTSGAVDHDELLVVNVGNSYGLSDDEPAQPTRGTNQQIQQVRRAAAPSQLVELPDHWYGYESVDAVVIATGGTYNGSLVQQLAQSQSKREALERWVLQGGHLVVTVAGNAAVIGSANPTDFPLERLLPVRIDRAGLNKAERLDGLAAFINTIPSTIRRSEGDIRGPDVPTARLEPKPGLSTFTAALISDYTKRPLIVRAPYGLGKVTVVGLDTNNDAFRTWPNKFDFWGAVLEARTVNAGSNQYGYYSREDVSLALANRIEEFGDVPVISFAVVAFFIAFYIILIGPVDYFVLKKVFKRLEYTWFTFPTIVLVVSLAAYFGAYYLKGDKLRINKVDVVELDLSHHQAAGTTWLAIFSPRLVNYNVDLAPQAVDVSANDAPVTMSWLGRFGSGARTVGQSQGGLFERNYGYTPDASGIRDLPIQVWSQKSLEARWVANLGSNQAPLDNGLVKDKATSLKGKLKSRLPRPLLGAKLLYGDRVWEIGTLEPDKTYDVDNLNQQSVSFTQILTRHLVSQPSDRGQQPDFSSDLNRLLFSSRQTNESTGRDTTNEYLRHLNQSWRLKDYGEAILVGTYQDDYGDAATLNQGGTLGTRLKLTGGNGNDLLTGSLRQATYLRIYIPVKEPAAK